MPKFLAYDINWDTDGADPDELGLPTETTIEADDEESVADALSDLFGWCVNSYGCERKEDADSDGD